MLRAIKLASMTIVAVLLVLTIASVSTGFSTWPWQVTHAYFDGDLGLNIGATKQEVWERVLEMQREGTLVPLIGENNDSRATTTEFSQVHDLDWWSFPTPPCCRCSVDLAFEQERLRHFERQCNYAPEGP